MTTKKRSVLLSVMTLVLCLSLLAGGTYALFSDQVTFKNHLQAGTLDATLTRKSATTMYLDEATGFITSQTAGAMSFTDPTNNNVFDIAADKLVVPGCSYSATLVLANEEAKSDVAFDYWIKIVYDDTPNLDFADQVKIEVETAGGKKSSAYLSAGGTLGGETNPLGTLAIGESEEFTVTVTFVDDRPAENNFVNNDAMGQNLNFDLVVYAVQSLKTVPATP